MYDVVVIGGGPAGIAASIYLKRADFEVILFEKDEIGGLLLNAYLVENYPGFPSGISGKNLCKIFNNHLKDHRSEKLKTSGMAGGAAGAVFVLIKILERFGIL